MTQTTTANGIVRLFADEGKVLVHADGSTARIVSLSARSDPSEWTEIDAPSETEDASESEGQDITYDEGNE